jgi:HAD superfamily hydrolase (TIGR01509 family)
MALQNLIFDLDGTLVDTSQGVVEAVNYSLKQMGQLEQEPEVIKRFIGYPLEQMYPHFTNAHLEKLCEHFQTKANVTVVPSAIALPGVEEVLHELRRRQYRMAIATTKIRRNIEGILQKFGWEQIFMTVAGSDEVGKAKPDPSIFRLTLERLKADPSETMAIGDTVNDVLAAKAVPMKITAVASPYGGREKVIAAAPDFFIESLSEIFNILDAITANSAR